MLAYDVKQEVPIYEASFGVPGDAGFHPVKTTKVKAIKNPSELKLFLGMLKFYGKFLPNPSSIVEPVH